MTTPLFLDLARCARDRALLAGGGEPVDVMGWRA